MSHEQIQIRTDAPRGTQPQRRKPRTRWAWILAAASVVCGVPLLIVLLVTGGGEGSRSGLSPGVEQVVAAGAKPQADSEFSPVATTAREQVVDDPSGELLWASPTAGPPLSLAHVPAGAQCLIYLRPALIASHPEGKRVIAALGPWGRAVLSRLRESLGSEPAEVNSLLTAIVVGPQGQLDASLRAELIESVDTANLARRFPRAQQAKHRNAPYLLIGDRAIVTIAPTTIINCPSQLAAELIDSAGEAPPLVRDLEALAGHADADRAVTVVVAPKFLQASGNELLTASAAPLHDAIRWLIGGEATAVALSAHWDENFFVELRATPALNVPPRRLAAKLRERIAAAPDAVEEIVLASPWHPHGRKVLARFPGMLRALARYSRSGEENRHALVRGYLPPMAGHNLLMAAELLLTQPRAGESASAGGRIGPATLEERLAANTSLTFTKDTLERALELLSEDIGVDIVIQGADLQLEGITKNQSLALDLRDRPAGEILVEILRQANPDRTATGPADPRQKLVYVVERAANADPGRIIVTTRTAAEKRGDALPAPFASKAR